MFQVNSFWPSFVGAKIQGDRETERGSLPVLLWPEQRRYLDMVGGIGTSGSSSDSRSVEPSAKKRKRADEEEEGTQAKGGAGLSSLNTSSASASKPPDKSYSSPYTDAAALSEGATPKVRGYTNPPKKQRRFFSTSVSLQDAWGGLVTLTTRTVRHFATSVGLGGLLPSAPLISHEEQRYAVFKDLQMKGFFIGPADVYGGDYNIYKGDPSNSHSLATIRVVYNGKVTGRDVLAFSRVQNQVAKSAVFAFVASHDPLEVSYSVINFKAVSDRI